MDAPGQSPGHARHSWDDERGRKPRRSRKGWLILVAVLVVAIGALAYYRMHPGTGPSSGQSVNPPGAQGPNTTAITGVPSPVHPGSVATIQAIADPGATCTLSATDLHGNPVPTGTGPVKADAQGNVAFAWQLGPHLLLGSYRLVVACQPGTSSTSTLVVT